MPRSIPEAYQYIAARVNGGAPTLRSTGRSYLAPVSSAAAETCHGRRFQTRDELRTSRDQRCQLRIYPPAARLPGLDRPRSARSLVLAGAVAPRFIQRADRCHGCARGRRSLHFRSAHVPKGRHSHPRQPPHDDHVRAGPYGFSRIPSISLSRSFRSDSPHGSTVSACCLRFSRRWPSWCWWSFREKSATLRLGFPRSTCSTSAQSVAGYSAA